MKHQVLTNYNYTFKDFYEKKCIFIHIPKTAGISVSTGLFGNLSGGHTRLEEYQMIFEENEYLSFFKFAFVRNPWDRVLSAYTFLKKGGSNEVNRVWALKHLARYHNFSDFVANGLHTKEVRRIKHFKPQHEFIKLPHESRHGLDFVAFFENIKEDYQIISARILNNPHASLPHINKSSLIKRPYQDYYNPVTQEIVADFYGRDIDLLGYEFENPITAQQLSCRNIQLS